MEFYKLKTYYTSDLSANELKEIYNDTIPSLEKDNGYHERLYKGNQYKFFLDIEVEGLKIETIKSSLLDFFTNKLNLKLEDKDIKYTTNDKKFNKCGSYHITIPKFYSELENLSLVVEEIKNLYNYEIDKSVYGNKRWFRLPNQCMREKKNITKHAHIIQNGKIKDFVLQHIDKSNSINLKKYFFEYKPKEEPKPKEKKTKKQVEIITTTSTPSNIEDLDVLLNGLSTEWTDDYKNWIDLGLLLYNIGSTVDKYIEISQKSKKYRDGDCKKKWASFNMNAGKKLNINSLWHWVKKCNIEYFSHLQEQKQNRLKQIEHDKNISIKIDKEYLTKKNLEIDDDLVQYFDDLIKNNKYKSINIKSPYGSSKTQLIHQVIKQYNPKKILWLSFRKTLSDDILKNFKDLEFEDYRDGRLDSNRLIIQLESLLKLENFEKTEEIDGITYNIIHKYDLIMLDEIESLLNQFNSEKTFSGKARQTFEYLEQLLHKCDNIISLDGDLDNRSFHFMNHFKRAFNIENLNKRNNKTLYITNFINEFDNEIFDLLYQNKKIAIATMSAKKAEHYHTLIKLKFPSLKIGVYTGTDNKSRKDFQNVDVEWCNKDVVIYSPTLTAGVSFNIEKYFYKIFGIINTNACGQRDFLQMLARIRYPEQNKITILNDGVKGNLKCFFTFEEVKQSLVESRKLKIVYKDGRSKMDVDFDLYDIITVYNDVEKLNKIEPLFLEYLYKISSEKGYKIEHSEYKQNNEEKKTQDNERKEFEKTLESKKDKIIKSDVVNNIELELLLKKQNKQEETTEEHFKINKTILEKQIGLKFINRDEKTEELINLYHNCPSSIKNFSYLIDEDNIKDNDDSFTENKIKQIFLIKEFLQNIGITSLYDNKSFTHEEFKTKLDKENIFKKENQIIFHTGKKTFNYTSVKEKYINTILKNYKLTFKISYKGKKTEENKIYTFDRLHYIDEIIYYKKLNKHIKDKNNLVQKPEILNFENYFTLKEQKQYSCNLDEGIEC